MGVRLPSRPLWGCSPTAEAVDLKSIQVRVRLPPLLPSDGEKEQYEKPVTIEQIAKLNDLEVFVYTYKGELVNIKSRWR
mgnify:CR=1 FL=1